MSKDETDLGQDRSEAGRFRAAVMRAWTEFFETQIALLDSINALYEVATDLDRRSHEDALAIFLRFTELPTEEGASFVADLQQYHDELEAHVGILTRELEDARRFTKEFEQEYPGELFHSLPPEEREKARGIVESKFAALRGATKEPEDRWTARLERLYDQHPPIPRERLLSHALLVAVVGTYETLLLIIVREFLTIYPGAQGESSTKDLSLDDLRQLSSVDDAVALLATRRAEAVLRGSEDDWCKWFSSSRRFGFSLEEAPCWAEVKETIQRRHLIVHNGGRVSRQYKRRFPIPQNSWDLNYQPTLGLSRCPVSTSLLPAP